MEITAQIAALEDEVKVLKGEIQSILKEIRTAILSADNPFTPEGGLPVFRPVNRGEASDEPRSEAEEAPQGHASAQAGQADEGRGPVPLSVPASPREEPLPQAVRVEAASPAPEVTGAPQSLAPAPAPPPTTEQHLPQRWSVSTVASLVAWIDETSARLGASYLHIVLDLASFAGLLPAEAEDVLLKVIKLAGSRKDSASPSVNDVLVALRQLETIFQQAEDDQLSLLSRRRSARGSR